MITVAATVRGTYSQSGHLVCFNTKATEVTRWTACCNATESDPLTRPVIEFNKQQIDVPPLDLEIDEILVVLEEGEHSKCSPKNGHGAPVVQDH